MITIENIYNSKTNRLKLHCESCSKTIKEQDFGLAEMTIAEIGILESLATMHARKHPKHHPKVYVYHRLPTNEELRG